MKINHPYSAALSHSRAAPAHFARPVRSWNDIASIRVGGNPVDECFAFRIAPYCLRLLLKLGGLNDSMHELIVHPIKLIWVQELNEIAAATFRIVTTLAAYPIALDVNDVDLPSRRERLVALVQICGIDEARGFALKPPGPAVDMTEDVNARLLLFDRIE